MNTTTGVVIVSMPFLALRFGASPIQLGLLGTMGSLTYCLACPAAGKLSDRWSRRPLLLASTAGMAAVFLSVIWMNRLTAIALFAVSWSLCLALFWPPLEAWLSEWRREGKRLLETLGLFNLSWTLGVMVGPLVGGFLYPLSPKLPFLCASLVALSTFFITLIALHPSRSPSHHALREDLSVGKHPDANRFFLCALIVNFINWFSLSILEYQFPKLALSLGFTSRHVGLLFFTASTFQALTFLILMHWDGWHYRKASLIAAAVLPLAGVLAVAKAASLSLLFPAYGLVGAGIGLSYFSSLYYGLHGQTSRGTKSGFHEMALGSGFVFGPLIGGLAAQEISLRAPYLLCAAVHVSVVVLIPVLLRRTNKKQ